MDSWWADLHIIDKVGLCLAILGIGFVVIHATFIRRPT